VNIIRGNGWSEPVPPVVVLGVGNELLTDEGLGVVAARQLSRCSLPGVEVVEAGTPGLALLPTIAGRHAVLILDAVAVDDATPGDLVVLRGEEVPRAHNMLLAAHQIGVPEAIVTAELAGCRPEKLAVVGMVPACLDVGYGLSQVVWWQLGALVKAARALLREWGVGDA
jgi:hydrogenase maturation protease